MPESFTPPSIVVGVDGSRTAVRAAVWAVDEAVSRDLPLRLLAVGDTAGESGVEAARHALHEAAEAVAATGRGVRVESEIVSGTATSALIEASATAMMICVGAVGINHFAHSRVGSTATALVTSAHCPVAVVRGEGRPAADGPGWVVVELDGTPDSAAVLQFGVDEARLRHAPLRVVESWESAEPRDPEFVAENNRQVRHQLDRRLSEWQNRYPDLDVVPEAVHGTVLDYLDEHAAAVGLIVVGARNAASVSRLLGPSGQAALHETECSVLVVDPQRLL